MYRPHFSLLAIALLIGCGEEVVLHAKPALAGDYGAPKPAGNTASALDAKDLGDLQPLNTLAGGAKVGLNNAPAIPPAMLAALEDLSKKSVAESQPKSSQRDTALKTTPTGNKSATQVQPPPPPRTQVQRKVPTDQHAGFRARHANGPASKIEALRERIHHSPSLLRRRGFHRAA